MSEVMEKLEVVFAIEGHNGHFSAEIGPETTVIEFAKIAARVGRIDETVEVFLEDADHPLEPHLPLVERLSTRFAPLHVARHGFITAIIHYNKRRVERDFRPATTVARIIGWAISPEALNLEGGIADYQLKHKGKVLSPDDHLGQMAEGQKSVELDLVFKIKPQG